jgi:hypothetical protein
MAKEDNEQNRYGYQETLVSFFLIDFAKLVGGKFKV